jgi:hypothetical protein
MQAVDWFHQSLGYSYNVEVQGLPADWLLDLVSIGFHGSLHSYGFENIGQLQEASQKFAQEKLCLPSLEKFPSLEKVPSPKEADASPSAPLPNLYIVSQLSIPSLCRPLFLVSVSIMFILPGAIAPC